MASKTTLGVLVLTGALTLGMCASATAGASSSSNGTSLTARTVTVDDASFASARATPASTETSEIQIISEVPSSSSETYVPRDDASQAESTWLQLGDTENYVDAVVRGNKITVTYHLNYEETATVIWVGTFESGQGDYSWTSVGDRRTMDRNPMAASESEKEFTVRDGMLTFSFTFRGETHTVQLMKFEGENPQR